MNALHGYMHRMHNYRRSEALTVDLKQFDLNLLRVFETIFRERSVTRAARQIGLSQPALSHALNRLRWVLKDELFIRGPSGMVPTSRAEELALPVRRVLADLQSALNPEDFVPAKAERRFTIALNNFAAIVFAAPVVARIAALAPGIRLCLRPSGTLDLPELLDRGELDLAVSAVDAPLERFAAQTLIEDKFVVAMRRGHPALAGKLTPKRFSSLPRLAISSSGDNLTFIDVALKKAGLPNTIALEAPYHSAGAILVQSDLVAVFVHQIAREFRRRFPIEIADLPFPSVTSRSIMLWHRRFDGQPAHRWLRGTIAAVASRV